MAEVKRLPDDGSVWSHFMVGDKAEVYTYTEGVFTGR